MSLTETTIITGAMIGLMVFAFLGVVAILVLMRFFGDDSDDDRSVPTSSTMAASTKKYNWLIGRNASVEGKTFHVGKRLGTVGRGLGNFIQITDQNASQVHAQFRGAASGMQIKDMGSSNGTFVNGERIGEASFTSLEDGDEITIGETVFAYRQSGDFRDEGLRGSRNVQAGAQKKTEAMSAIGGGDLKEQVKQAVDEAGGDYEKAAEQLGLDAEIVENIVLVAEAQD